jgi:hypothetical protein
VKLLRLVSDAYDRATGVGPAKRRHDSWIATERKAHPGERPSLTTLERILVVVVAMAAIAFEIWFFFFSTSPIDQRSGRGAVPLALLRDDRDLARGLQHRPGHVLQGADLREPRLLGQLLGGDARPLKVLLDHPPVLD